MIQDIFPGKFHNEYLPDAVPAANSRVLHFFENKLMIKDGTVLDFPTFAELLPLMKAAPDTEYTPVDTASHVNIVNNTDKLFIYLFTIDSEQYFLLNTAVKQHINGYSYITPNEIRGLGLEPKYRRFAVVTGKHLYDWYRDTRFCGRCGQPMLHSVRERAMQCPSCSYTAYPRIMPAIIAGVTNGDKIILTRYRSGYRHNALIAGFVEIGETAEETVKREVMEEVGLTVKNIRYYKSQPWGSANDILLGFYCDVDGNTEITMDSGELKYAEWVSREDIILQPDDDSLTNEMMKMFKEGATV